MRPEGTRVWRKAARRARRGLAAGRRPRLTQLNAPQRGSTWLNRHPGDYGYWSANVRPRANQPVRIPREEVPSPW